MGHTDFSDSNIPLLENFKTFENSGKIETLNVSNADIFQNKADGLLIIGGASNLQIIKPLINLDTFLNQGTIQLKFLSIDFQQPDEPRASAFIINDDIGDFFKNEGIITTDLNPNPDLDHATMLFNAGTFENSTGASISFIEARPFSIGILNQNHFDNLGNISVNSSNTAFGIVNQVTFINEFSGSIFVDDVSDSGINNEIAALFENRGGDITIGISEGVNRGISNAGIFKHFPNGKLDGILQIVRTSKEGIEVDTEGTFFNNSTLRIGKGANGNIGGASGIEVFGSFINQENGTVEIENIRPPFDGFSGNLSNFGKITIRNAATSISASVLDEIINEPCGLISIDNVLFNRASFTNNGFLEITQIPATPHDLSEGIFINNAIIEDPLGTIDEAVINNKGILICPDSTFSDEDPIIDLFKRGGLEGNYSFGPEVRNDNDELIGNFISLSAIDLIDSLSIDTHNLHFTITNTDGVCFEEVSFPLIVLPDFSCRTRPTSATDGQNNGAIDLILEGGTVPFEFQWITGLDTFTTQNLTDIGPGEYEVTVTDTLGQMTNCSADIIMPSFPKTCNGNPMRWDGGVTIIDGETVIMGDGISWSDPFNWSTDKVPTANDAVGATQALLSSLVADKNKITLDVDATIESGRFSLELTIPAGNVLNFTCDLSLSNPIINGDIIGNGRLTIGAAGRTNNGTIDITGIGADETMMKISGTYTNNGIIQVNNLVKGKGTLLETRGSFENKAVIQLENGGVGMFSLLQDTFINQVEGIVSIESTTFGMRTSNVENFGLIEMGFANLKGAIETGISPFSLNGVGKDKFINRPGGIVTIFEAETGISLEPQDSFINQGLVQIGDSLNTRIAGEIQTGILNEEGIFINEDTLRILDFMEKGIHNLPDGAKRLADQKAAIFINSDTTSFIELAGNLSPSGAPIPEFGVINEGSFLKIKEICLSKTFARQVLTIYHLLVVTQRLPMIPF